MRTLRGTDSNEKVASAAGVIGPRKRAPPTCSRCGEVGHKRQRCDVVGVAPVPVVEEPPDDLDAAADADPVSCPPSEDPAASVG